MFRDAYLERKYLNVGFHVAVVGQGEHVERGQGRLLVEHMEKCHKP